MNLWNKNKASQIKKTGFFLLSLFSVFVVLTACSPILGAGGMPFYEDRINLADINYAAADMLSQNTKIDYRTPLVIGQLRNKHAPQKDVPFDSVILEQVATRLLQLGYNIKVVQEGSDFVFDMPENAENLTSRDVLLTGSYTPGIKSFFVSLRLIRLRDNILLGAYDYTIPMTHETKEMTYRKDTGGRSWFDLF